MTTTIRLPRELHDRLSAYCSETGAVQNRIVNLALRSYLDDGSAPALPLGCPDTEDGMYRERTPA